jgi:hypothetical protein
MAVNRITRIQHEFERSIIPLQNPALIDSNTTLPLALARPPTLAQMNNMTMAQIARLPNLGRPRTQRIG